MYPQARLWIKNNQAQGTHMCMHIHSHIHTHTGKIYTKICDILLARKAFDLQFLIYLAAPPAMPPLTLSSTPAVAPHIPPAPTYFCSPSPSCCSFLCLPIDCTIFRIVACSAQATKGNLAAPRVCPSCARSLHAKWCGTLRTLASITGLSPTPSSFPWAKQNIIHAYGLGSVIHNCFACSTRRAGIVQ